MSLSKQDLQSIKSVVDESVHKAVSESEFRLNSKIEKLQDQMESGFKYVNHRIDNLSDRVDKLSHRVDKLSDRVDSLSDRVDSLSDRVDSLSDRVDSLNDRVGGLEVEMIQTRKDLIKRIDQQATDLFNNYSRNAATKDELAESELRLRIQINSLT